MNPRSGKCNPLPGFPGSFHCSRKLLDKLEVGIDEVGFALQRGADLPDAAAQSRQLRLLPAPRARCAARGTIRPPARYASS